PEYVDCLNLNKVNTLVNLKEFGKEITSQQLESIFNLPKLAKLLECTEEEIPVSALADIAICLIKDEELKDIPALDGKLGSFITTLQFQITRNRILHLIKINFAQDQQAQALLVLNNMFNVNLEDYFNLEGLSLVIKAVTERKDVTTQQAQNILQPKWSKFFSDIEVINFAKLAELLNTYRNLNTTEFKKLVEDAFKYRKLESDLGLRQGIFNQALNTSISPAAQHNAMQQVAQVPQKAGQLTMLLTLAAAATIPTAEAALCAASTYYGGLSAGAVSIVGMLAANSYAAYTLFYNKDTMVPTKNTYATACFLLRQYSKLSNSNGGAKATLSPEDSLKIESAAFANGLDINQLQHLGLQRAEQQAFIFKACINPVLFLQNKTFIQSLKLKQIEHLHAIIKTQESCLNKAQAAFSYNAINKMKEFIETVSLEQRAKLSQKGLLDLALYNPNLLKNVAEERFLKSLTPEQKETLRQIFASMNVNQNSNSNGNGKLE
nr:hypothetical protein [Candidatus Dependentiae bacterium]